MVTRLADKVRALLPLLGSLGAGSRALLLRLTDRFGWKAVFAAGVVAVYAVARYRAAFVWLLAVWCAAAWMHTPREDEQPPEETGEQPTAEAFHDPLPGILWDLIGDAPGVHVKRVVAWLHENGWEEGSSAADVRAGLARRGVPLRASVRDAAGRVNQGVHRDDLEAWEKAHSPAPPAAPSETRSYGPATPLTSGSYEAATAVATPPTPAD
ncbi:hypothetical protein [Streptomyces parvulus]|uniref:hypothetical protein n=1 Tax=Streptomyces parvulus TaxID=146923 RepID=UPI00367A8051